jgi:Kef-type K+ transport system membrane component KefB/mannitol/fructose-specific phosphotransferase system IIA component (Ntr-type)
MLETVAWLGVLFLLLETGLEVDFSSAWRQRGDALKIALTDIIVPMIIAFIPSLFLPTRYLADPDQRWIFALFMATVMTISAMPIAVRVLHDLKLLKSNLGFLIMSALSVNDIIGWLIFTLILGFFTQSQLKIGNVSLILLSTIGFTAFCLTIGRHVSNYFINFIRKKRLPEPGASLTFICIMGCACGAITQRIGIHSLFGFFLAGIMAGEAKALSERTRQVISQMVYAIFVPLFFVNIGMKVDFIRHFDVFIVLVVCVVGITGRFYGAWLGVNLTKQSQTNRLAIAVAHTPGGAMEIVVGILALEYRLITESVFIAIVVGALVSSILLGPWLSYAIKKRKIINILEYFNRRMVLDDIRAKSRDTTIEELCIAAAEQESVLDLDELKSAVMTREYELGTAIEDGIAVPHIRIPHLESPMIVFGRSVAGIDWNSPDGKLTHFVFLILSPTSNDVHIQVLREIARVMSERKTRNRILQAKDHDSTWNVLNDVFSQAQINR